jgi:hypothetical protein
MVKCEIGNENVKRISPSYISYSATNEGSFGCTGLSVSRECKWKSDPDFKAQEEPTEKEMASLAAF